MKYQEEERKCDCCGGGEYKTLRVKPAWTPTKLIKDEDGRIFHSTDVMCSGCGLVYKNPMLTKESMDDFYREDYAKLYRPQLQDSISKNEINNGVLTTVYTLDWLSKIGYDLRDKRVMEVGTGMGILMKGMEGEGAIVTGIDPDKRSIELASKLFGFKFLHKSLKDLFGDIEYRAFDLVVCNNTLEHFYSPVEALQQMQGFLRPGGKILIEVPNVLKPYCNTVVDGFLSSAHNYTFDHETFRNIAAKAGLKIKETGDDGHKNCMFFLLSPSNDKENPMFVSRDISSHFKQVQDIFYYVDIREDTTKELLKELLQNMNVDSIIERIKSRFPYDYNQIMMLLANRMIEHGRIFDGLAFLEQYGKDQPKDININFGSFLYFKAMCYRQLGDFIQSRKLLKECTNYYPNIRKYNFVKDLEVDGVVSNTNFADYLWWNAERALQSFG